VAWSLFWLAIAWSYVGVWAGYWVYAGFFAVSLSLVMVGVGCFVLGKLYGSRLPVINGVINVIAAILFFFVGFFMLPMRPSYPWPLEFAAIFGYGFLIAGLFLWAMTAFDVLRSVARSLSNVTGVTSLVSAIIFLLQFPLFRGGPIALTLFTQLFVLAQVLSAMLLHKISSDNQRRPQDSKQA
jgi:hypothetical protein